MDPAAPARGLPSNGTYVLLTSYRAGVDHRTSKEPIARQSGAALGPRRLSAILFFRSTRHRHDYAYPYQGSAQNGSEQSVEVDGDCHHGENNGRQE